MLGWILVCVVVPGAMLVFCVSSSRCSGFRLWYVIVRTTCSFVCTALIAQLVERPRSERGRPLVRIWAITCQHTKGVTMVLAASLLEFALQDCARKID